MDEQPPKKNSANAFRVAAFAQSAEGCVGCLLVLLGLLVPALAWLLGTQL